MAVSFDFRIQGTRRLTAGLQESRTRTLGALNRGLRNLGRIVTPMLQEATPRRTGKLRSSTRFRIRGRAEDQTLEILQTAKTPTGEFYGRFVRVGTRPHTIRPVRAQALRFEINGRIVFAKRVRHPGTRPNPYARETLRRAEPRIRQVVEEMGRSVRAEIGG